MASEATAKTFKWVDKKRGKYSLEQRKYLGELAETMRGEIENEAREKPTEWDPRRKKHVRKGRVDGYLARTARRAFPSLANVKPNSEQILKAVKVVKRAHTMFINGEFDVTSSSRKTFYRLPGAGRRPAVLSYWCSGFEMLSRCAFCHELCIKINENGKQNFRLWQKISVDPSPRVTLGEALCEIGFSVLPKGLEVPKICKPCYTVVKGLLRARQGVSKFEDLVKERHHQEANFKGKLQLYRDKGVNQSVASASLVGEGVNQSNRSASLENKNLKKPKTATLEEVENLQSEGRYGAALRLLLRKSASARDQFSEVLRFRCQKEFAQYSKLSSRFGASLNVEKVEEFNWEDMLKESEHYLPTLHATLESSLTLNQENVDPKQQGELVPCLGTLVSMILRMRKPNQYQFIPSLIGFNLYNCGSDSKCLNMLNNVGLCLPYESTKKLVSEYEAELTMAMEEVRRLKEKQDNYMEMLSEVAAKLEDEPMDGTSEDEQGSRTESPDCDHETQNADSEEKTISTATNLNPTKKKKVPTATLR